MWKSVCIACVVVILVACVQAEVTKESASSVLRTRQSDADQAARGGLVADRPKAGDVADGDEEPEKEESPAKKPVKKPAKGRGRRGKKKPAAKAKAACPRTAWGTCNGAGKCINGKCKCETGYSGANCVGKQMGSLMDGPMMKEVKKDEADAIAETKNIEKEIKQNDADQRELAKEEGVITKEEGSVQKLKNPVDAKDMPRRLDVKQKTPFTGDADDELGAAKNIMPQGPFFLEELEDEHLRGQSADKVHEAHTQELIDELGKWADFKMGEPDLTADVEGSEFVNIGEHLKSSSAAEAEAAGLKYDAFNAHMEEQVADEFRQSIYDLKEAIDVAKEQGHFAALKEAQRRIHEHKAGPRTHPNSAYSDDEPVEVTHNGKTYDIPELVNKATTAAVEEKKDYSEKARKKAEDRIINLVGLTDEEINPDSVFDKEDKKDSAQRQQSHARRASIPSKHQQPDMESEDSTEQPTLKFDSKPSSYPSKMYASPEARRNVFLQEKLMLIIEKQKDELARQQALIDHQKVYITMLKDQINYGNDTNSSIPITCNCPEPPSFIQTQARALSTFSIGGLFRKLKNFVVGGIKKLADKVVGKLKQWINKIKDGIVKAVNVAIINPIKTVFNKIKGWIKKFGGMIKKVFNAVKKGLKSFGKIMKKVGGALKKVGKAIGKGLAKVWNFIKKLPMFLLELIPKLLNKFIDFGRDTLQGEGWLARKIIGLFRKVASKLAGLFSNILGIDKRLIIGGNDKKSQAAALVEIQSRLDAGASEEEEVDGSLGDVLRSWANVAIKGAALVGEAQNIGTIKPSMYVELNVGEPVFIEYEELLREPSFVEVDETTLTEADLTGPFSFVADALKKVFQITNSCFKFRFSVPDLMGAILSGVSKANDSTNLLQLFLPMLMCKYEEFIFQKLDMVAGYMLHVDSCKDPNHPSYIKYADGSNLVHHVDLNEKPFVSRVVFLPVDGLLNRLACKAFGDSSLLCAFAIEISFSKATGIRVHFGGIGAPKPAVLIDFTLSYGYGMSLSILGKKIFSRKANSFAEISAHTRPPSSVSHALHNEFKVKKPALLERSALKQEIKSKRGKVRAKTTVKAKSNLRTTSRVKTSALMKNMNKILGKTSYEDQYYDDGGHADAGAGHDQYADAGHDGGYADAGHDGGYADAGHDAGYADAGHADAGHADAGYADAGHDDQHYADGGHGDGQAPADPAHADQQAPAHDDPAPQSPAPVGENLLESGADAYANFRAQFQHSCEVLAQLKAFKGALAMFRRGGKKGNSKSGGKGGKGRSRGSR